MKTLTKISLLVLVLPTLTGCVRAQPLVFPTYYVDLNWQDNSPNNNNPNAEDGFALERNDTADQSGTAWFTLVTLPAGAQTHRDTALAANRMYSYRVRAFNTKGYSNPGNTIIVATPGTPPPPGGPPDVPLSLAASPPQAEVAVVRSEAENLLMVGSWSTQTDPNASGGARAESAAGATTDKLIWQTALSVAGNFELRIRVLANAGTSGQFTVIVDGGAPVSVSVPLSNLYSTVIVNLPNLAAGTHEIHFSCFDSRMRMFDAVALTVGPAIMGAGQRILPPETPGMPFKPGSN